jgi:Ca2+-binding RTX toxin-like protein
VRWGRTQVTFSAHESGPAFMSVPHALEQTMEAKVRTSRRLVVLAAAALLTSFPFSAASAAEPPTCFGKPATIVGTAGPDNLSGGPDDVVVGLGGDDSLTGGTVCGGSGNDSIRGAWRASSSLDGGDGDDAIRALLGPSDLLLGGAGNDYLADSDDTDWEDKYDPGTDVIKGGTGNDHIVSTSGRNMIYGNAGDDRIYDYTHVRTSISGGAGNDATYATGDNYGSNPYQPDNLTGGEGSDFAEVNRIDKVSSTEDVTYVD